MFTYPLLRIVNYKTSVLNSLELFPILFMLSHVGFLFLLNNWSKTQISSSKQWIHFSNFINITILFVLININNYDISTRYYFIIYFFWPLIIHQYLIRSSQLNILFRFGIIIFITSYFIYKINYGTWHYENFNMLYSANFISFLMK